MSFQNRFGNDCKLFSGNLEESSWTIYGTTLGGGSRANISKRI
jgi:hypothetical protein